MKLTRSFAAAVLAAGLCCATPAFAAADPDHYLVSPSVLDKMKAAEKDLEKAGHKGNDDDARDNPTVEELIRDIEKDKAVMAALMKHGITSRDYALTSFAMLHAGFFVMMEGSMDKKKAAELMATYTKEQRANIALVRTMKK